MKFKAVLMYFWSDVIIAVAIIVSLNFLSGCGNVKQDYITSVIFSSCSNYGTAVLCTCKNECSQASDKANIWELHVSTPHEFLTATCNSWCGPTNESIVAKMNKWNSVDSWQLKPSREIKKKFELSGARSK